MGRYFMANVTSLGSDILLHINILPYVRSKCSHSGLNVGLGEG